MIFKRRESLGQIIKESFHIEDYNYKIGYTIFSYVGYDKALYRNFKFFRSGYKRIVEQYVVKLNCLLD